MTRVAGRREHRHRARHGRITPGRHEAVPAAQEAAVDGIVAVLDGHLVHDAAGVTHTGGPHVILVDGRFRTQLVARLAMRLRDLPAEPWAVARFDAWQYRRLAPPWWWLITTIDRELQAARSRRGRFWPLLTAFLRERPQALEDLQRGAARDDAPADLHPLFRQGSDPQEIAQRLTVGAVRQFTRPLTPYIGSDRDDADAEPASVAA